MDDKVPEVCENCERRKRGMSCNYYFKNCTEWRLWFKDEWNGIREAARQMKEQQQCRKKQ